MKQSSNAKSRTGANDMTDSLQDVVAELNGKANTAYINYIRTMQKDDCLGLDYKSESGLLRKKNVEEFMRAAEFLGAHRALTEAADRLSALAAPGVSDADRRDAERYRWLREFGPTAPGIAPCAYHFRNDSSLPHPISGEALDVAIDAALSPWRSGEVDRG